MNLRLAEILGALCEARAYVSQSEQWVSEQSAIIGELESSGADTLDAILYLEALETMHEQNIDYLTRLERKVLLLVSPED
jgi:hypothetical protein